MKTIDALAQLLAINGWVHLPLAKDGRPFGPGFFRGRNWRARLGNKNRRVAFRLRQYGGCLACQAQVSENPTGDHLIALANGGPDDASNYVPLCRSCNASKGKRDFFMWWQSKNYQLRELPTSVAADLICAYARLTYEVNSHTGGLDEEAPGHVVKLIEEAKMFVPESHWKALESV